MNDAQTPGSRWWGRPLLAVILLVTAILLHDQAPAAAYPYNPLPTQPGFENGKALSGAAVDYASPTLADLNGDGKLEIVVGGRDGRLYAVESTGNLLWQFDAAAALNTVARKPSATKMQSAPAIGDLDGDGAPEVVVGLGDDYDTYHENGGVVVLSNRGTLRAGWPRLTTDMNTAGDGYTNGVFSSPALGDLDGDGTLEIVVGSYDMHVHAWHHDGRPVAGWPRLAYDTVWSSPVLADLDNDGRLEVIIGADASDGGRLYVYRGDGSLLPGFPIHTDQTIFSSPAVADLDGDGWLDIVVGSGNYYEGKGRVVYAWNRHGSPLAGWPVSVGNYAISAPTVGDIDGDNAPEVIIGATDGKLYAFEGNGSAVRGWPVAVYDNFGNNLPFNFAAPVLANFDSDSTAEIFINMNCDVVVLDGNGTQLTHVGNSGASGKPTIYQHNVHCTHNTPAVADIDRDGKLEIVRAGGTTPVSGGRAAIFVWESNRGSTSAPWPMFRRNSLHAAAYPATATLDARIVSHTIPAVMAHGASYAVAVTVENTGTASWTRGDQFRLGSDETDALAPNRRIELTTNTTVAPGQRHTFRFTLTAPQGEGYFPTKWRMVREGVSWFGIGAARRVKVGSQPAYYVLSKAGLFAGGIAPPLAAPSISNWSYAQTFKMVSGGMGYQLIDTSGALWQGGSAQPVGGQGVTQNAAEIVLAPNSTGYYILGKDGRLSRSYGAMAFDPVPQIGAYAARSAALTPDGRGVYILDSRGQLFRGGNAPALGGTPTFTAEIARRIKLTADGRGYYVLDAYGRLWNGGNAPALQPRYDLHMGEDWARDFELTADGRGYYLLSREGIVYPGGMAPQLFLNPTPPWLGQDIALDLEVVESRLPAPRGRIFLPLVRR